MGSLQVPLSLQVSHEDQLSHVSVVLDLRQGLADDGIPNQIEKLHRVDGVDEGCESKFYQLLCDKPAHVQVYDLKSHAEISQEQGHIIDGSSRISIKN